VSILVSILVFGALQSGSTQTLARLQSDAPILVTELPQLQAALSSQDAEVRLAALRFWATRGREAWDALYKEVLEPDRPSYGRIETFCQSVVRSVDRAIDSPDLRIRVEGLRTLCALGTPASDLLEQGFRCGNSIDLTFGEPSWNLLVRRVPSNRSLALELVGDAEPTVVFNAIRHLAPEDRVALQTTIQKLLSRSNKLMRAVGLHQLKPASDRDVLRWIAPLIDDPDEEVAEYASSRFVAEFKDPAAVFPRRGSWSVRLQKAFAQRIAGRADPRRVPMLLEMLKDSPGEVREVSLSCLSSASSSEPCPLSEAQVRRFLLDPYGGVRAAALRELYERKVPDIIELQRRGLTDPSESVRDTAAWCSMRNFDLSLTQAVVKNLEMGNDGIWMLCSYFSDPANDRFLDGWLESNCVYVRQTAALAMKPDKERDRFLPRLLKAARDSDPDVLRYAIYGLTTCGGAEAAAAIREIGRRSQGEQLVLVLTELGKSQDRESIGFLKSYVESPDRALSKAATQALRQLTNSLIPPAE